MDIVGTVYDRIEKLRLLEPNLDLRANAKRPGKINCADIVTSIDSFNNLL
jgi:hypothetical protein